MGDAHVELLQILVNNCQRPDFMERLRQDVYKRQVMGSPVPAVIYTMAAD